MQSDRQEVQCRGGARNLGSNVLDSVLHRSNVRAHGFVLMAVAEYLDKIMTYEENSEPCG